MRSVTYRLPFRPYHLRYGFTPHTKSPGCPDVARSGCSLHPWRFRLYVFDLGRIRAGTHYGAPCAGALSSAQNALACHHVDNKLVLEDVNYVALRAYNEAAGKRVSFNEMSRLTGIAPVKGALIPVLVTFADPANPATARAVAPDDAEAVLGKGYRLQGLTAEVVPNGYWPLDFGGVLGEAVSRGIQSKLPWLSGADNPAAVALRAAGLPAVDGIDAKEAFTRK